MGENLDYKILHDISTAIARVRGRDELFSLIIDRVQPIFGFNQYSNITVYNHGNHTLQMFFTKMSGQEQTESQVSSFLQPFAVAGIFQTITEADEIVVTDESWKTSKKTVAIDEASAQIWRDLDFKYALSVALRSLGELVGTFHVHFYEPQNFSPSELELFTAVSEQIAVAVANILANEEILEREREKSVLLAISEQLAATRNQADLFTVIFEQLQSIFRFDDAVIVLFDKELKFSKHLVSDRTTVPPDDPLYQKLFGVWLEIINTPYEEILRLTEPTLFNNSNWKQKYPAHWGVQILEKFGLAEEMQLPLRSGGGLIGTLEFHSKTEERFSPSRMPLFRSVANQVAVAVANILANEEILEREQEKTLLLSIGEDMATIRDRDALFCTIIERLRPKFGFQTACVTTYSDDSTHYRHLLIDPSPKLLEHQFYKQFVGDFFLPIADTPDAFILERFDEDDLYYWHTTEMAARFPDHPVIPLLLDSDLRHNVHVALRYQNRIIGFFHIHYTDLESVDESLFGLLRSIAKQMAVAVANILANEKVVLANEKVVRLAKERHRRADELAKSNDAIARTAERLTALPDLSDFLGQVLIEAAKQLGADAGQLTVLDESTNTLHTKAVVEADKLVEVDKFRAELPADEAEFWRVLRESRRPHFFDVENDRGTDLFWRDVVEYHKKRRHKAVLAVPLFAGDKPLGHLGLAFADFSAVDEQRTELVTALANQAALAIQLTRLASEAERVATLQERNRIAREIHDTLAQSFTGVVLQLETAKRVFGATTPAKVAEHVERSIEFAREGLAEARRSVQKLRPEEAESTLDLSALFREKLAALTFDTDIEAEFTQTKTPRSLPPGTAIHLLRIGQEAITNALRHSGARRITVTLDYGDNLSLLIADDGSGFDTTLESQSQGFGLRGMRERAAAIKARLEIHSRIGIGTEIKVSLGDAD